MTKQEQIEDMILTVKQAIDDNTHCVYNPVDGVIEVTDFDDMAEQIAEKLYNAGYRKISDGSVVVSKKIWEEHIENWDKTTKDVEERVRKETAKEILAIVGNISEDSAIDFKLKDYQWFKNLCKKYKVEVDA